MPTRDEDLDLVGSGLLNEADDQPCELSIIHGGEVGGVEVDDYQFGLDRRHRPTTPPFTDDRDDRLILLLLYMSDDDLDHGLRLSTQSAQRSMDRSGIPLLRLSPVGPWRLWLAGHLHEKADGAWAKQIVQWSLPNFMRSRQ